MISAEIVTQTWQSMSQTPYGEAHTVVEQMQKEQPVALAYLLALEVLPFTSHEHQIVFYIGLVVWQVMKQSDRRLNKVTTRKMDRAEAANDEFLSYLASDTDADFVSATQSMLEKYPEPEVLGYILEAIMDEDDYDSEDPPIRDEYRGLAFINLKTVLDAFIDSLAK